jgi:hypothetical protein
VVGLPERVASSRGPAKVDLVAAPALHPVGHRGALGWRDRTGERRLHGPQRGHLCPGGHPFPVHRRHVPPPGPVGVAVRLGDLVAGPGPPQQRLRGEPTPHRTLSDPYRGRGVTDQRGAERTLGPLLTQARQQQPLQFGVDMPAHRCRSGAMMSRRVMSPARQTRASLISSRHGGGRPLPKFSLRQFTALLLAFYTSVCWHPARLTPCPTSAQPPRPPQVTFRN